MSDHKALWQQCLDCIRSQMAPEQFAMWFKDTRSLGYTDGKLSIRVPSEYFVMQYENRLYDVMRNALIRTYGPGVQIEYTYDMVESQPDSAVTISTSTSDGFSTQTGQQPSGQQANRPTAGQQKVQRTPDSVRGGVIYEEIDPQLNAIYTFENYVCGASNLLPFNIAESIGNNPRKTDFNPFFLYGNTGVGKTHLIQAIGLRVKERYPHARVLYISARQFETQYGAAVRDKRINDFINFYQSMDALIIDDIQELSGKTGTQNVFFPIFNYLHEKGTLLVMSSDRPPVDLEGIMERLINRFKRGITQELPAPDMELRKSILRYKSHKHGLALPEDVIEVIANHATSSVRELEGIVVSLIARATVMNQPVTPQLATVVMQSLVRVHKRQINFDMIVEATAEGFHLDPDVIFSRSRVRDIADARQVIMYLAYKHADLSSKSIGTKLSRSHVTVLHGIKTVENRISVEPAFSQLVDTIERLLHRQ